MSKEDTKYKESESIINQKKLIQEYLNHHNLTLNKQYIDDGYSGTTFDRPAFKELIKDVENKKINMIITKDLSRLGRNYVKCGYYIEEYFPKKQIRYISILDNIDTAKEISSNDIAPFKALFNDMVSKDTSKKIKSILKTKKQNGEYLSSKAPYGYQKNPKNKHKLIIDKKNAKIVKTIFTNYLNGKTINEITRTLNKQKILTPSGKGIWNYISVYNILNNPTYTGITIQNVWTNISYKNKTRIKKESTDWIINKHAHQPIINNKIYNQVKTKLKIKNQTPTKTREKLLLEGIIFCQECGHSLGVNHNKKRNYWYLTCNNYKKNSTRKICSPHYINYNKLETQILNCLKKHIKSKIHTNNKNKINNLKNKLKLLYEDRLNQIITKEEYLQYQTKINNQIKELTNKKSNKINRQLLLKFINKITISKDKQITIYYNFKKP